MERSRIGPHHMEVCFEDSELSFEMNFVGSCCALFVELLLILHRFSFVSLIFLCEVLCLQLIQLLFTRFGYYMLKAKPSM